MIRWSLSMKSEWMVAIRRWRELAQLGQFVNERHPIQVDRIQRHGAASLERPADGVPVRPASLGPDIAVKSPFPFERSPVDGGNHVAECSHAIVKHDAVGARGNIDDPITVGEV